MMKKRLISFIAVFVIFCLSTGPVYAGSVTYTVQRVGENTLRVTLNSSDPNEAGKLSINSYVIKEGKYIDMTYETAGSGAVNNHKDFDLRTLLYPVRILLYKAGDYNTPVFSDIKRHYAEPYIHHLHDAGIVKGRPDGSFMPDETISRAEFMVMVLNALNIKVTERQNPGFTDVDGHWARNIMLVAVEQGILAGFDDKTLQPDKRITTAEACTITAKAFSNTAKKNGIYQKLKQGQWYSVSVKKVFDTGILAVNDRIYENFNENSQITRADCAMMISRALTVN